MTARKCVLIALGLFGSIQLVPYGRDHANPIERDEPSWDSTETRAVFFRACRDCHSNETVWPWYSHIAPISWSVQHDVEEGRSHLNVSDWARKNQHGDEAAQMVRTDEMPLWFYLPLHPDAQLSAQERESFIAGLSRTFPEADEEAPTTGSGEGHAHEH